MRRAASVRTCRVHCGEAHRAVRRRSLGGQPGFAAEREQRADLHAGRPGCERRAEPCWVCRRAGQPEGQAERGNLGEVGVVARAVDRLAGVVEHHPAAWRCVVAAGGRSFDDEPVRASRGVAGQIGPPARARRRWRGTRALQRRQATASHGRRVRADGVLLVGRRAVHLDGRLRARAGASAVEQVRDLARDAAPPGARSRRRRASRRRQPRAWPSGSSRGSSRRPGRCGPPWPARPRRSWPPR